jgi:hypothetical protein
MKFSKVLKIRVTGETGWKVLKRNCIQVLGIYSIIPSVLWLKLLN